MNLNIKLPENPKLWLTIVTQDREKDIDELTKDIYQYFDGIIAVDGGSKDNTVKILESRKGAGEILYRKYTDDHDLQRNQFMTAGVMKNFDWHVHVDSGERLDIEWCRNLKSLIKEYQSAGIGIGMIGRPYLMQYFDDQIFMGNAHCWVVPLRGKAINLNSDILTKKIMDERSGAIHPFKYFWLYGRSNETQAMYGKYGQDIVNYHENLRLQMRWYWQCNMGREFTLESVERYFSEVYLYQTNIDKVFLDYIENEFRFADFFRLKILKHDIFKDIVPNRYSWSFKSWLETGDEKQINSTNISLIMKYNRQFGFKDE